MGESFDVGADVCHFAIREPIGTEKGHPIVFVAEASQKAGAFAGLFGNFNCVFPEKGGAQAAAPMGMALVARPEKQHTALDAVSSLILFTIVVEVGLQARADAKALARGRGRGDRHQEVVHVGSSSPAKPHPALEDLHADIDRLFEGAVRRAFCLSAPCFAHADAVQGVPSPNAAVASLGLVAYGGMAVRARDTVFSDAGVVEQLAASVTRPRNLLGQAEDQTYRQQHRHTLCLDPRCVSIGVGEAGFSLPTVGPVHRRGTGVHP